MEKKIITKTLVAGLVAVLGFGFLAVNAYAEGEEEKPEDSAPKTSMTIMPVSRTLQISSESTYDGKLNVTNDGDEELKVEAYAAPYSYVYSSEEDVYKLGFNNENNFTQISRWITVKDDDSDNYAAKHSYKIPAHGNIDIQYKITTPKNIPAGGQYAVLFVQTVSSGGNSSGIRTEASAGMVIYGHSTEGETITSAEISDMKVGQGKETGDPNVKNSNFYGSAKVKNTGNTDFFARGKLKVEPIIGFSSYETPSDRGTPSVIPESERVVEDEWAETPDFGIYKVTWTVSAGGEEEMTEQVFVLISPIAIIITIIVLTIIIVWIIMGVRKRKERRSRLAV